MVAIVTVLCFYHKLRKRKRQLEKIAEVTKLAYTLHLCSPLTDLSAASEENQTVNLESGSGLGTRLTPTTN